MSIQYALYPNSFHRRKPKAGYVARVHHTTTCDQKMLVELMASRNGALSPALIGAVLEEYAATLEYALASGMRVSTPVLKMQASIQGTFADAADRMYPGRQQLVLKALPGPRLQRLVERMKAEKVDPKHPCPQPRHLEDIFSDTINQRITPRGILRLRGNRLKFDPEDARQGIFLLPAGGGERTRLAKAMTNVPSQLIVQAPEDLPAGEYTLEVRAIVGNSTQLRHGRLPYPLTVIPS